MKRTDALPQQRQSSACARARRKGRWEDVIENVKSKFQACSDEGDRRFVTYMDCLKGDMATPSSAGEGKLFLSMFAFFTALAMIPVINIVALGNPVVDGLRALATLPVWFCVAFTVRSLFANELSLWAIARFVSPRFGGVAETALSVLVNVAIMAPVMCVFGTAFGVVLAGGDWSSFGWSYLAMLPKAAGLAWLLVFFVARPLTGLVFGDVFIPLRSARNSALPSKATM